LLHMCIDSTKQVVRAVMERQTFSWELYPKVTSWLPN
jgi:hypothetical protein